VRSVRSVGTPHLAGSARGHRSRSTRSRNQTRISSATNRSKRSPRRVCLTSRSIRSDSIAWACFATEIRLQNSRVILRLPGGSESYERFPTNQFSQPGPLCHTTNVCPEVRFFRTARPIGTRSGVSSARASVALRSSCSTPQRLMPRQTIRRSDDALTSRRAGAAVGSWFSTCSLSVRPVRKT
jgi:hypothetical protein